MSDGPGGEHAAAQCGAGSADERAEARRRAARRAAIFGDDPVSSADERDPGGDRGDGTGEDADRRRYDAERPPHHDRP